MMISLSVVVVRRQPTQILAKKAQLSARVVIPPVGLKLEVNFKIDVEILCHH